MTTVDNLLLIFLGLFLTVGPFIVALFTNHKRKILILIKLYGFRARIASAIPARSRDPWRLDVRQDNHSLVIRAHAGIH